MLSISSQGLNIAEENLHCHHLLFIRDVTTSTYDTHKDCFLTKVTNLSFRRAKLNGIIVAQESLLSDSCIWLDDGTSVIRVILPKSILKRPDGDQIEVSRNITVFGTIEFFQNTSELMIQCIGFRLEESDAAEMYHWLKVIQDRPKSIAETAETDEDKMFHSLSSLPSPRRLLKDNFLESPIRDINATKNPGFLWSPDHAFATSTPIRTVPESPLRQRTQHKIDLNFDDDFEEFDDEFGSTDYGALFALENNALLSKSGGKRKLDFTEDQ